MPDPREAVYDVLLSKKRRADEEKARQAQRVGEYRSHAEAWAQYEEENARANAIARNSRSTQGTRPQLVVVDELSEIPTKGT